MTQLKVAFRQHPVQVEFSIWVSPYPLINKNHLLCHRTSGKDTRNQWSQCCNQGNISNFDWLNHSATQTSDLDDRLSLERVYNPDLKTRALNPLHLYTSQVPFDIWLFLLSYAASYTIRVFQTSLPSWPHFLESQRNVELKRKRAAKGKEIYRYRLCLYINMDNVLYTKR